MTNKYTVTIKRTMVEFVDIDVEAATPEEALHLAEQEAEQDAQLKWQISDSDTEHHDITNEHGFSLMDGLDQDALDKLEESKYVHMFFECAGVGIPKE